MDFKVGDRVKFAKHLGESPMKRRLLGQELVISEVLYDDEFFDYEIENVVFGFKHNELELVEEGVKKMKINEIFEKNDINARYEFDGDIWKISEGENDLINGNRNFLSGIWSLRTILKAEFTEIEREIDWTKVPKWTKVNVRDRESYDWVNLHFLKFDEECEFKYRVTPYSEFTNGSYGGFRYNCIRLDKSVTIKEEWYK